MSGRRVCTGRVELAGRSANDQGMLPALARLGRRKPKLPPAYTVDWHPFVADSDGISCRVCCLPRANFRHGDQPKAA